MAEIAGMAFVAVHDGQADAPIVWQSLIAFQTCVDLMNRFPQRAGIHLRVYGSHGFGAGHGMAQPMLPEPGRARHLQSVEAAHARPKQDDGCLDHSEGGNARFQSPVRDGGKDILGEAADLLGIGDQAPENVRASFPGDGAIPVRKPLR